MQALTAVPFPSSGPPVYCNSWQGTSTPPGGNCIPMANLPATPVRQSSLVAVRDDDDDDEENDGESDCYGCCIGWSICNCLCCCWLLGIVAIVYAVMAACAHMRGSNEVARDYRTVAVRLNVTALVTGVTLLVVVIVKCGGLNPFECDMWMAISMYRVEVRRPLKEEKCWDIDEDPATAMQTWASYNYLFRARLAVYSGRHNFDTTQLRRFLLNLRLVNSWLSCIISP